MGIKVDLTMMGLTEIKTLELDCWKMSDLQQKILQYAGVQPDLYYVIYNGKFALSNFKNEGILHVIPRLSGGKGGFGSMLRAIGAQIEKTTNREACRDLSGRRLRDINEEQRLKKWISQQADRERDIEERKKKRLEKLASEPKHEFKDDQYDTERSELTEKVSDSIEQGLKAVGSGIKRKSDKELPTKKKKKTLLDLEELSSSDESEGGDFSKNSVEIAN